MIQHSPSVTAPATMAAAILRSSTTCFHTSKGASLVATANAAKNAITPKAAKIKAFRGGKSVMASLYEDFAQGRKHGKRRRHANAQQPSELYFGGIPGISV